MTSRKHQKAGYIRQHGRVKGRAKAAVSRLLGGSE